MSLREQLGAVGRIFERAFNQEELDLTEGGIAKPLFILAIPIVITNLFQTAYNLADTFWVGRYSTEALAAISFAFPMVFLLISLGMGLSVAGSVIIAQNIGAGDERQADYAASQTVSFAVVVSIVLGAVGYFVVDLLIGIYGASPEVKPLAVNYMEVISLGLVFMFGFFVFISLMRGAGDTVTPMIVMAISVVINILLDPFLIFGFENNPLFAMVGMTGLQEQLFAATGYTGDGLKGAAIATVFSRAIAFLIGLGIMFRGNQGVQIRLGDMAPDLDFARRILEIGVPASVEGVGRALSVNLLLIVVGLFATPVVSAYGIGTRVLSVVFMPAIAMARSVETMTGQNVGADKPDRAAATAAFASKASFLILTAVGVIAFVWAEPIVSIFVGADQPDAPRVIEVGAEFMRFVAPTFGFMGIMRAYNGSFRGAGKTTVAAVISVGTLMVFRLPIAWLGSQTFGLGSNGLWLSFALSNAFGAAVAYLWYQRGTWRGVDLEHTPGPAPSDD